MRNRLAVFMLGRNGLDQLATTVFGLGVLTQVAAGLMHLVALNIITLACWGYALFRVASRHVTKRRDENYRFVGFWGRLAVAISGWRDRRGQSREYKFFRCPDCKSRLRVPRGKGRLMITCSRCGQRFDARS